jgi:hypothetical protein
LRGEDGEESAFFAACESRVIDPVPSIMEVKLIMKEATKRSIVRRIHIVFAVPILGYIYSPFEKLPDYAPKTRFVFVPVMVLSGLWMWKGHVVRRLISKRSAQGAADNL